MKTVRVYRYQARRDRNRYATALQATQWHISRPNTTTTCCHSRPFVEIGSWQCKLSSPISLWIKIIARLDLFKPNVKNYSTAVFSMSTETYPPANVRNCTSTPSSEAKLLIAKLLILYLRLKQVSL